MLGTILILSKHSDNVHSPGARCLRDRHLLKNQSDENIGAVQIF